jgi:hypothetical protein
MKRPSMKFRRVQVDLRQKYLSASRFTNTADSHAATSPYLRAAEHRALEGRR